MNKNKILYLGLDPTNFQHEGILFHHPIIKIIPIPIVKKIITATHLILTSKTAAQLFFQNFSGNFFIIAIGEATKKEIEKFGISVNMTAKEESQEGLIHVLEHLPLKNVCYPHAKEVRPLLREYLKKRGIPCEEIILYETVPNVTPVPEIAPFDEIVFTSPSCVEAFIRRFKKIPKDKKITCIGPITKKSIEKYL